MPNPDEDKVKEKEQGEQDTRAQELQQWGEELAPHYNVFDRRRRWIGGR